MPYRDLDPTPAEKTAIPNAPESEAETPQRQAAPSDLWDGPGGLPADAGDALRKSTNGRLARAGNTLLQLQNQYGNQYVQRVVNQAQTIQRKELGEQDTLQRQPRQPNNTGLPDQLKHNLEHMSGLDMSDVRVHSNSPKPTQVQAAAYTQGSNIYLGSGQEQFLPHEAWHVVQQKQGRVQPTLRANGLLINDNPTLEQEAHELGVQAAQQNNPTAAINNPPLISRIAPTDAGVVQGYFTYKSKKDASAKIFDTLMPGKTEKDVDSLITNKLTRKNFLENLKSEIEVDLMAWSKKNQLMKSLPKITSLLGNQYDIENEQKSVKGPPTPPQLDATKKPESKGTSSSGKTSPKPPSTSLSTKKKTTDTPLANKASTSIQPPKSTFKLDATKKLESKAKPLPGKTSPKLPSASLNTKKKTTDTAPVKPKPITHDQTLPSPKPNAPKKLIENVQSDKPGDVGVTGNIKSNSVRAKILASASITSSTKKKAANKLPSPSGTSSLLGGRGKITGKKSKQSANLSIATLPVTTLKNKDLNESQKGKQAQQPQKRLQPQINISGDDKDFEYQYRSLTIPKGAKVYLEFHPEDYGLEEATTRRIQGAVLAQDRKHYKYWDAFKNSEYYVSYKNIENKQLFQGSYIKGDKYFPGSFASKPIDVTKAVEAAEVADIVQGNLADCYFRSALMNVVNKDREQLLKMIIAEDDKEVTIQYYHQGTPVDVKVSKTLPHDPENEPLYGKGELWPNYFLKAFVFFAREYPEYATELENRKQGKEGYQLIAFGKALRVYSIFYGEDKIDKKVLQTPKSKDIDQRSGVDYESTISALVEFADQQQESPVFLTTAIMDTELLPRILEALPVKRNDDTYKKLLGEHNTYKTLLDSLINLRNKVNMVDQLKGQQRDKDLKILAQEVRQLINDGVDGKKIADLAQKVRGPAQTLYGYLLTLQTADKGDTGADMQFAYMKHIYAILDVKLVGDDDQKGSEISSDNIDLQASRITIRNPHGENIPSTSVIQDNAKAKYGEGAFTISLDTFLRQFGGIDKGKVKKK